MQERILIIDLGSQYTQLIARRIRECGVYSEVIRYDAPFEEVLVQIGTYDLKGIVLSGGPSSVYEKFSPSIDPGFFKLGVPMLGICYGMQLIVKHFGGVVEASEIREYGKTRVKISCNSTFLFNGMYNYEATVWMSHGDKVIKLPKGFRQIAETIDTEFAAIESSEGEYIGIQFHPEVHHTVHGKLILDNYVRKICHCDGKYQISSFIDKQVEKIRENVKNNDVVICGLSGGVDSAVAAAIVHKAIGNQLHCVFVDHGLLRYGEREEVEACFRPMMQNNFHIIDNSDEFLTDLIGVIDPEIKRKIIGARFIKSFTDFAQDFGFGAKSRFLVQGTLYPDVIESESVFSQLTDVIKSHHNVGGLPDELGFELIEPLRMFFKDEVRLIGVELGLPHNIIMRQPFPGPGLAIRVIGEVTKERLRVVRCADTIVRFEIERQKRSECPWQYYAALLPVKSVGVMGDKRTYEETIVVRAVSSVDGMTADWSKLDFMTLGIISNRIVNEISGVNRVVYDITSKPPGTIEWE